MKNWILAAGLVLMAGWLMFTQAAGTAPRSGKLRHVVCFKFKETASAADIQKVIDEFRALKKKIRLIKEFECGTNVSPEKLDKGFTHCFVATFATEKDRDDYLVHPEHKAFVEILKPVLAEAFVVDYWAQP